MESSSGLPPGLLRELEQQDPELAKLLAEASGDAGGRRAVILSQLRDPALARLAFQFLQHLQKQALSPAAQTQLLNKLKQQMEQLGKSQQSQQREQGSDQQIGLKEQDARLVKLLSTLMEGNEAEASEATEAEQEGQATSAPAQEPAEAESKPASASSTQQASASEEASQLTRQGAHEPKGQGKQAASQASPETPDQCERLAQAKTSDAGPKQTDPPATSSPANETPAPLEDLALPTEESLEPSQLPDQEPDQGLGQKARPDTGDLSTAARQGQGEAQTTQKMGPQGPELQQQTPLDPEDPRADAQAKQAPDPNDNPEAATEAERSQEQASDAPRERPAETERKELLDRGSGPHREEAAQRAHEGPKRLLPPMTQPQINLLAQQLLAPALAAALASSGLRPGDIYIQSYKLPGEAAPTLYVAMDLATRFAEMSFKAEQSQAAVADFVDELLQRFPYQVRQLMTRRTQSLLALPRLCKELGVRHHFIEPNGRLYRGMSRIVVGIQHGILRELDQGGKQLERLLADYCNSYNYILPQQALSNKTPWATVVAWFSR